LLRDPKALRAWSVGLLVVIVAFAPQAAVLAAQFRREGSGSFFTFPTPDEIGRLARAVAFSARYLVPVCLILALVPLARRSTRSTALLMWLLIAAPLLEKRLWVVILPRDGLL